MVGLVLKLAPKERVLINGAVLENDVRRSRFSIVTPSANVLRLKDAIHPKNANTPVSRVCYQLQLILAGSTEADVAKLQVSMQVGELSRILTDSFCQKHVLGAHRAIQDGKFYSALKLLKALLPIERDLLATPMV